MRDKAFELLAILRDGAVHSGEDLARRLGITRAAVWSRVQRLESQGLEVFAVPGKGYRLVQPLEFLDADTLRAKLGPTVRGTLAALDCLETTDSTNQQLMMRAAGSNVHGEVLFAEYQTAGRGRRGDVWIAPPGSGLCMSLGWRFEAPPSTMSALGLAIGVAVARAAESLGASDVRLKWPNDVLYQGRKLAGILVEMRAEYGGPSTVVIGIGLNCRIPPRVRARITQPVADLSEALRELPARSDIAARLVTQLVEVLREFTAHGFAPFARDWQRYDGLAGQAIQIDLPDRQVTGIARGVDASGMLLLERDGRFESFLSGHVRLANSV
jgi:BirA family biotin operon repressor/biotin-[acetyl-CoA-carboxylase] ligase